jgi:hypothetical protein
MTVESLESAKALVNELGIGNVKAIYRYTNVYKKPESNDKLLFAVFASGQAIDIFESPYCENIQCLFMNGKWITHAANSKEHLCATCQKEIPTCDGNQLEYGDAVGKDNITACDGYVLKPADQPPKPNKPVIIIQGDKDAGISPAEAFSEDMESIGEGAKSLAKLAAQLGVKGYPTPAGHGIWLSYDNGETYYDFVVLLARIVDTMKGDIHGSSG